MLINEPNNKYIFPLTNDAVFQTITAYILNKRKSYNLNE